MHSKKRIIIIPAIIIAAAVTILAVCYGSIKAIGHNRIQKKNADTPGRVKYGGDLYEYDDDVVTFLVMGIDKGKGIFEEWARKSNDDKNPGQADALFLTVLNTRTKTIQIIGINRNTMTDINFYDDNGNYITTFPAQIALQYAYGTNKTESCEYQLSVVENLFYHIPIHGYAAVNIGAVPAINDRIGGVDVEVLEDLTEQAPCLVKGSQVHLTGESAYWYVKYRDTDIFASVDMRMTRQAQYLNSFIDTARQAVREDPLLVLKLYQDILPQTETNLSFPEIMYLASDLPQYQFDQQSFHTISGNTIMGEEYEEFYPDEAALFELILDVFYQKVENGE